MANLRETNSDFSQRAPTMLAALAATRITIEDISPCVDAGKYPAKGVVDQYLRVSATIVMDGHDQLAARVLWREQAEKKWQQTPLHALGNDRWTAAFAPHVVGPHQFIIEAWFDRWGTYREELRKKHEAGLNLALEIKEGIALMREVAENPIAPKSKAARQLRQWVKQIAQFDSARTEQFLLADNVHELISALDERQFLRRSEPLAIDVERRAAGYASWYELFPRSQGRATNADGASHHTIRHGTFDDVITRLPAIQAMGFDVLYFPPIHPIGHTHRKGRNNQLLAADDDPGSPYAIGSEEGGHDAVHPALGGIEAFRRLQVAAADYGIEIALDFAIQCSPDHPWLKQHPEWFSWRPDGSIRYAENPPKKYEDIVNVDFYAEGAKPSLWIALRDVILYWIGEGVKIFRVDNPHTKPLPFWQWLIADVRARHPDAIFLAEAFTRPAMMYELAKIGFTQSYTYFTWRNTKQELTDYLLELADGPPRDFFRPHFFVNTPDINPYFLQTSGRGGFKIRAALAATLSGLWGLYSGFELCEAEPIPGKEEYLHSEKYEIKPRDWNAPGNIINLITCLNRIRRENPALQTHLGIRFFASGNDQVLYFAKQTLDRSNTVIVAISLDPHRPQQAYLEVPFALIKNNGVLVTAGTRDSHLSSQALHGEIPSVETLYVEELLRGQRLEWRGAWQHWYFDPDELPLAIWRIGHEEYSEADAEKIAAGDAV